MFSAILDNKGMMHEATFRVDCRRFMEERMTEHEPILTRRYASVRHRISDGDILLVQRQPVDIQDLAISISGRSTTIHAMMAAWRRGRLYALDTYQGVGGRETLLSKLVDLWPSQILVRKVAPEFIRHYDRSAAVAEMRKIVNKPYGWWALRKASLIHIPVVRVVLFRWLLPSMVDDGANGSLPFCSMAVSRACRAGGIDPVPNLADGWTEPSDLLRSASFGDCAFLKP